LYNSNQICIHATRSLIVTTATMTLREQIEARHEEKQRRCLEGGSLCDSTTPLDAQGSGAGFLADLLNTHVHGNPRSTATECYRQCNVYVNRESAQKAITAEQGAPPADEPADSHQPVVLRASHGFQLRTESQRFCSMDPQGRNIAHGSAARSTVAPPAADGANSASSLMQQLLR